MASYSMARRIAGELKDWIQRDGFTLGQAQLPLPSVAFDPEMYPQVGK
jgi:hypothetical protein